MTVPDIIQGHVMFIPRTLSLVFCDCHLDICRSSTQPVLRLLTCGHTSVFANRSVTYVLGNVKGRVTTSLSELVLPSVFAH
jgi:hypothetical protein